MTARASQPGVSVIVPCYDQATFLMEAVESVAAQTYNDWEVVIVDDGSPDDTASVAAEAIARIGDRVRLVRQANAGVAEARNAGIRASTGRYIVPLDADDHLDPHYLDETVGLLERQRGVGVAYTDYREFGARERIVRVPEFDGDGICRGNHILATATYPRAAWEAVGGYNANMALAFEDWDFWLGCVEKGFIPSRIPKALVAYRIRAGTRNDRTAGERRAMTRQLEANHPALFTTRRRLTRRLRRVPRNLHRESLRLLERLSRGRLRAGPEPW